MKNILLIFSIFTASFATANVNLSDSRNIGKNLLYCVGEGGGSSFKRNCGAEGSLSYATPLEVQLSVTYSFPGCESSNEGYLTIGISNEAGEKHYLAFPSGGTLSINTSGSLNFFNETRGRRIKKVKTSCELKITEVKQAPSAATQAKIDELNNLITKIEAELPERRKNLIATYNQFISLSFNNQRLFCLISSYDDPIFDDNEVLIDLKEQFAAISGKSYEESLELGLYSCDQAENLDYKSLIEEIETECTADIRFNAGCATLFVYKQNESWLFEMINRVNDAKFNILDALGYKEVREETVSTIKDVLAEELPEN